MANGKSVKVISQNPHMGLKFMFQIMHGRFAPNFLVAEVTLNYHSTCNQSRRWRRSRSNTNDTLHTGTKNKFCVQKINLDKILLSGIFEFFAPKLEYFSLNKYQMFEFLGKNVRVGTVCTVKIVNFMQGSSQVVDWYANGNATAIFLGKFLVEYSPIDPFLCTFWQEEH